MANEKVLLPKEVAQAIEILRRRGANNHGIYFMSTNYAEESSHFDAEIYGILNDYVLKGYGDENIDKLMQALVNGYEVEQTQEELLRDYYKGIRELSCKYKNDFDYGTVKGIKKTLGILGITIEGINA